MTPYNPEEYWSEVGKRIELREKGENVIAGDDEPYYQYKREKFLQLLNQVNFEGKSILEIGCGPGGNLLEIYKHHPKKLVGVDISGQMVQLSKNNVPVNIEIIKTNGTELPFNDNAFDIVFTATVLQHNTDEAMLKRLMRELCRVSADKVYLFERIETKIKGDGLNFGRPISYYSSIMKENGFQLISENFINIRGSYYLAGIIRKFLNSQSRKEGEPLNKISILLQNILLPFTKLYDPLINSKKDLARLEFRRISLE